MTTRAVRMAALALAIVACSSDQLAAPGPTARSSTATFASASLGTQLVITEIMIRPSQVMDANGEWFELYNGTGADIDLRGYRIMSFAGGTVEKHTITSGTPVIAPAGRCVVIGNNTNATANGGVAEIYSYAGTIQFGNTNAAEALWLRSPDSLTVFDSVAAAVRTPTGFDRTFSIGSNFSLELRDLGNTSHVIFTDTSATQPWKQGTSVYSGVMKGTPGVCPPGSLTPVGPLANVVITSPTPPVNITKGATTTFRANGVDAQGQTVTNATITWSTTDPAVVEVNAATGAVMGLEIGDTRVRATATSSAGSFQAEIDVHVVAPPPPPILDIPSTHVSELHYDNNGDDVNEAIEIEGDVGVSLDGWKLALYSGNGGKLYNTIDLSGAFLAGCSQTRGARSFAVVGLQNGGSTNPEPDGFALIDGAGTVVQFLSYEGSFVATDGPAAGMTTADVGIEESSSTTAVQSLQLNTTGTWERRTSNFGQVNSCATATGTASISISHNGPDTLVVGWQRRAFVTYRDANGTTVSPTPTITWTSDTPAIASVDPLGYAIGVGAGKAIIRATIGATSSTYSFDVIDYESIRAEYRNHLEFGIPQGADPSNNLVIMKPGFVTSYNAARGGPNWVSWNINSTTFGDAERCECFSSDAQLGTTVPEAQRITDQDYANGGYDRGHMVQSESRTSTASENAATFLLTNILPQAANNNQGPWLGFENFLNDRARLDGRQVYVVAGGEYAASPTTLKGAGRVAIPDYTWKVAIVMNHGLGLSTVDSPDDITVYAIRIPNLLATAPAKNNNYSPFITTVDDIEARTGYDFFAALPDNVERIVEANDRPPVPVLNGPGTGLEGSAVSFDASASTDPDLGDVLTYEWSFGNGITSTATSPTVIFSDNGSYAVSLTVTDRFGASSQATKTITIGNVAPTVAAFTGASIMRGETYTAAGSFTDPGADSFTATANYGDGTGVQSAASSGHTFSLSHTYATSGTFTVTVTVTDDDNGSGSRTATVTVISAADAIGILLARVAALEANGTLSKGEANALDASLRNALKSIEKGNTSADGQLGAFGNKVEAMLRSGRLDAATAADLIGYATRILASIG